MPTTTLKKPAKRTKVWTPEFIEQAASEDFPQQVMELEQPETETEAPPAATSVVALGSHSPDAARPEIFDNSPDVVEARRWLAELIDNPPTYNGAPIAFRVEGTPARAIALLERNFKNRNIGEKNLRFLMRQIANGKWKENGQTIGVSTKETGGILLNGQHRLTAVVKTGISIYFDLRLGLPLEAQHTMDNNKSRTAADALWIKGLRDTNALAAACKLMARYLGTAPETPAGAAKPMRPMDWLSPEDHEEIAQRYPRLSEGTRLKNRFKKGGVTGSSTVVFWTLACLHNRIKAEAFLHHFETGENLVAGHPALVARNWFFNLVGNRKATQEQRLSILIKAFNAFSQGKTLKALKAYNPEVDNFPQIPEAGRQGRA